jgi:hypothetical protein
MGLPEPAEPDTVTARLVVPAHLPQPVSIAMAPDTLTVGRSARLRLAFPPDAAPVDALAWRDSTAFSAEWIGWDPASEARLTAPDTLVVPVRIYQIDPFRIETGALSTPVVLVDLRTSGLQETATIRDPRRWGWNLFTLLTGAAVLTALLLLAYWLWTAHRVAAEKLPDWDVPPPAWLQAAIGLKELVDEELCDRGQPGPHLDRLASLCRRFLAGRYRVSAVEMTGAEIRAACAERGHAPGEVARFTSLLEKIDSSRYDPVPPSGADCRRRSREFMTAVGRVRILPRFTPVDPAVALAAERAWSALEARLHEPGDRQTVPAPGEEGGA